MSYIDSDYGNKLETALRKLVSRPALGQYWFGFHESEVPAGVLLFTAGIYSRILYADFWQYVQDKNLVKAEEEWQSIYNTQGWCPFYSDGDGIDTFRMPSAPLYLHGANTLGEAGAYVAEGLPDHTHTRGDMNIRGSLEWTGSAWSVGSSGAFSASITGANKPSLTEGAGDVNVSFNAANLWTGSTSPASEANPIYGASAHVTPATSKLLFGVWAISTSNMTLPDPNAEAIAAEQARAEAAEAALQTALDAEVTRATGAELANATAIESLTSTLNSLGLTVLNGALSVTYTEDN